MPKEPSDSDVRDGIYFPRKPTPLTTDEYRQQWENEAEDDFIVATLTRPANGREMDFEFLTSKVGDQLRAIPAGSRFENVLEIGCGYGRIPLYLSGAGKLNAGAYYALDISESLLKQFQRYRLQFGSLPGSTVYPICTSAESIPLDDNSMDLVLSAAVLIHMEKPSVRRTLEEIARVLKPGGMMVLEGSFLNGLNPTNFQGVLRRTLKKVTGLGDLKPNYMKYWTAFEIGRLLENTGINAKIGECRIEAWNYAFLPERIGRRTLHRARLLNRRLASGVPLPLSIKTASFTVGNGPRAQRSPS